MIALAILIIALLASTPLANPGHLKPTVRQSSRGPPQWPGNISNPPLAPDKGSGQRAT